VDIIGVPTNVFAIVHPLKFPYSKLGFTKPQGIEAGVVGGSVVVVVTSVVVVVVVTSVVVVVVVVVGGTYWIQALSQKTPLQGSTAPEYVKVIDSVWLIYGLKSVDPQDVSHTLQVY
jgi:hypothetical protein